MTDRNAPTFDDAGRGRINRPRALASTLARAALSEYSVLFLAVLYFLAAWPFVPDLATGGNLANIFANTLPLLAVAIGQTLVLITGGIDLSVTSVIALASVVGASVMNGTTGLLANHPASVPAAVAAMLLVGVLVGLFNALAVTMLRMPPFIVTLTTMMFVGGFAVCLTQSRNVPNLPDGFVNLAYGSFASGAWFAVPYSLMIVAALALAAHVVLGRTLPGRWLYAVGHNADAARVSGVPVRRVVTLAYVASGFCGAMAAVLYTARLETGSPVLGREIMLDVVGAAVIGGTSLFGGKGKVLWTVFGVLLFTLITNTLNLLGLTHYTVMMVKGAVILLAALLDLARSRFPGVG